MFDRRRTDAKMAAMVASLLLAPMATLGGGSDNNNNHDRLVAASSTFDLEERTMTDCGCLSEPPAFDLPPPPQPPASFWTELELEDWTVMLGADGDLPSCLAEARNCHDHSGGVSPSSPDWSSVDVTSSDVPSLFGLLTRPVPLTVCVATAAGVLLCLLLGLIGYYCRKNACRTCCAESEKEKRSRRFSTNFLQRNYQSGMPVICPPEMDYNMKAGTRSGGVACRISSTYNTTNGDINDYVNTAKMTQLLENCGGGGDPRSCVTYSLERRVYDTPSGPGAVSTYKAATSTATTTATAAATTRPSPPRNDPPSRAPSLRRKWRQQPSVIYDSHNPVYEEISLHDRSAETVRASSTIAADERNAAVDGGGGGMSSPGDARFGGGGGVRGGGIACVHADCCSGSDDRSHDCGDSPCDCSLCGANSPDDDDDDERADELCPFSPRPGSRRSVESGLVTPSPLLLPVRKINQSTQSEESCLDVGCHECSGRESGYGTEGPRWSNNSAFGTWHDNDRRQRLSNNANGTASDLRFHTARRDHQDHSISPAKWGVNGKQKQSGMVDSFGRPSPSQAAKTGPAAQLQSDWKSSTCV